MNDGGFVRTSIQDGVATVTFFHPKRNALPGAILRQLAEAVTTCGKDAAARVVVLRSEGQRVFCAGASFDELKAIDSPQKGKEFFMGFARLILAMKNCPKFVICRVQGKAVGGGVGVAAAADYALAVKDASVRLSELAVGIGPFVVGPAVARKIGSSGFNALALDTAWRDASWACTRGLYADLFTTVEALDKAVDDLARRLAASNPEAMECMKAIFWEGTDHWDALLEARAETSGKLVLSEFTTRAIAAFDKK